MTREQLHSTQGFHPPSLLAAALHLRTAMRRVGRGTDATAIINNEGRLNGYLEAIDDLIAAASPKPPEAPKKEYQAYAEPKQPDPNPKQNQP
jgi:hypothetical protein